MKKLLIFFLILIFCVSFVNASFVFSPDDLQVCYDYEINSSSLITDYQGNVNLSTVGTFEWYNNTRTYYNMSSAVFNQSAIDGGVLDFDGAEAITMALWINKNVIDTTVDNWVGRDDWTGSSQLQYLIRGDDGTAGKIDFLLDVGSEQKLSSDGNILANTWYFIVGTYDGTTQSLYIDGSLNNSRAQIAVLRSTCEGIEGADWTCNAHEVGCSY